MEELFGTDGIRGLANEYPITSEMALRVGRAAAALFCDASTKNRKIIIGKDTRISGTMLEHALISGITSAGADACLTGILPTPGIACLTAMHGASAGIVISASHNPFFDNGIKLFNQDGFKLSEQTEKKFQNMIVDEQNINISKGIQETGRVHSIPEASESYINFLKNTLPEGFSLKNLKIVIDCANGATYRVAPMIFQDLGAELLTLFAEPDGKNINDHCGSQYPEILAETVRREKADIGLAFDGDGDRLIAVDETGRKITGDQILAVCARMLKTRGMLKNNIMVSTVMSNLGLGMAMKKMDILHLTTRVGDRHVMAEMVSHHAIIGGEDSGHIIFLDHHTTGDGLLAALRLLEAMLLASKPLSELIRVMDVFPQELINVDVESKPDIHTVSEITDIIQNVEEKLGSKGRVLVRYSGTQPMCRVMVEGPSIDETKAYCRDIADVIKKKLG